MENRANVALDARAPSGATMKVWTVTPAEAEAVAEALHEAQPGWRVRINGRRPVFSREGKVLELLSSELEAA